MSEWSYGTNGVPTTLGAGRHLVGFAHDAAGREVERHLGGAGAIRRRRPDDDDRVCCLARRKQRSHRPNWSCPLGFSSRAKGSEPLRNELTLR